MNFGPDETPLDQSLREVFQDYHLPPAEHPDVWNGLAQQLAAQPALRAGLSYHLVLPLTAALGVGMALGWLLPRPASTPLAQQAEVATVRPINDVKLSAIEAIPSSAEPAISVAETPLAVPAKTVALAAAQPIRRHSTNFRTAPLAPSQPAVLAAANMPTLALAAPDSILAYQPLAATDSSLTLPASTVATDSVEASLAAKAAKPKEPEESVILYHKPTHRLSERGIVIRRWFAHLGKSLRHLLGQH